MSDSADLVSSVDRLLWALEDPDATFTAEQMAYLMSTAMRWGYEARVDEENAAYPPPPVFAFGRWFEQAKARAEADARKPGPDAFQGGLPPPVDLFPCPNGPGCVRHTARVEE